MGKLDAMLSSENQLWQTPREALDPVDLVFSQHDTPSARPEGPGGPIDCDPCGGIDDVVNAARSISEDEDGLSVPWTVFGRGTRLFVNSEYGLALPLWTSRARYFGADPVFGGIRATSIIGLWPSRTDTDWYGRDVTSADAICHWSGRLQFRGAKDPAPFPSVLPYWGPLPDVFADVFIDVGTVTITRGSKRGLYQKRRTPRHVGT